MLSEHSGLCKLKEQHIGVHKEGESLDMGGLDLSVA